MRYVLLVVAICQAAAEAHAGEGWLNVQQCGASGSRFETTAKSTADSKQITIREVGDFRVGQGVMVSRGNIRYTRPAVWGTGEPYYNSKPLGNSVEFRGYDGSAGSWLVYILDIDPSVRPAFRWTDDLGRTWHPAVRITGDWQPVDRGLEVRFNARDWQSGYVLAFGARDQLVSRIEKIDGHVLTLTDVANRSVTDAVVRHCDDLAIRNTVDRAIAEHRNVYFPPGHYRLAHGVIIRNAASITLEGASSVDTLLDISDGEGSCFTLRGGTEVTLRNFRMLGFMGFDERDKAGYINTRGSTYIWGFALKHCNAVTIGDTQRVLVENCHASRMSGECFVSGGSSRATVKPGQPYSQAITYLRCSVTDSARNAFNDVMCGTENTCVLQCRIQDVGGCAWEGASRFVKFVGNYVRNAGTVAMGNLGPANRDKSFDQLGAGQHLIADNVFESNVPYGACAIRAAVGATQVIVRNNLFVNFNSSAVEGSGATDYRHFPSANMTITGNVFDMTCVGDKPSPRTAINVSLNDAIVSDNQVYVRGPIDPLVTGIELCEPALNLNVHDNLIRNCGQGIVTDRGKGRIAEVTDPQTFTRTDYSAGLPLDVRHPELTRNWTLLWLDGGRPGGLSTIEGFDPATLRFRLSAPRAMKAGDRFEVIAPSLNWSIHDNVVTGCRAPMVLYSHGSETSRVSHNMVTRGEATGVKAAVTIQGTFQLIGNHVSGFDEAGSAAVALVAEPSHRTERVLCRENVFEHCSIGYSETRKGLWKALNPVGNQFIQCGSEVR